MQGLELSERFYREVGRPSLEASFPELFPRLAAGLAGEGSECLGYDDSFSRDHDFGPAFCLWMTDEDFDRYGESLNRWYGSLPGEFAGFPARSATEQGRGRVGAMRISDFYRKFTGCTEPPDSDLRWLRIPEHFLRQATGGRVFEDPQGVFSGIRAKWLAYYPEEVRRKKLAARAVTMAQAGQYNFPRMLNRGDAGAAFLAMSEFVRAAVSMAHLLERKYTPYYKWMFRSMRELTAFSEETEMMQRMISQPANLVNVDRIERICESVVRVWKEQGLTASDETFLEPQGWELFRQIRSPELRRLHILDG